MSELSAGKSQCSCPRGNPGTCQTWNHHSHISQWMKTNLWSSKWFTPRSGGGHSSMPGCIWRIWVPVWQEPRLQNSLFRPRQSHRTVWPRYCIWKAASPFYVRCEGERGVPRTNYASSRRLYRLYYLSKLSKMKVSVIWTSRSGRIFETPVLNLILRKIQKVEKFLENRFDFC